MTTRTFTTADLRRLAVDVPVHLTGAVLDRLGIEDTGGGAGGQDTYVIFDGPTGALFVIFGVGGISRVVPVSAVEGGEKGLEAYHRAAVAGLFLWLLVPRPGWPPRCAPARRGHCTTTSAR